MARTIVYQNTDLGQQIDLLDWRAVGYNRKQV